MIKKICIASLFFALSGTLSYAGIFYMGPSLQYESISGDSTGSYQATSARLTLGYAEKLQFPYYLAGEFFGVGGDINGHPDDSDLKNTPSFGVALLPGFMLYDNTFLYGRLGMIASRFSATGTYEWGGQLGFGIETAITETWDIRTEYIFTQYSDLNGAGSVYGAPHSNTIAIGFIHRFK